MKPHTPMIVPPSFIKQYPIEDIQLPKKLENDLEDCAKALIEHRPYGFALYDAIMEKGMTEYKKWLQAYLASVSFIDHQVGKILDALEDSPYADNTIIIFTSDNGYHMGEKDFYSKIVSGRKEVRSLLSSVVVAIKATYVKTQSL